MAELAVVYKDVDELVPYADNPRINDAAVDAVANSIREFGFKVPVVLDRNNVIVAGHTRVKASRKLSLKQIPCIIADDLTDEQIRAFRVADNRTAELADWDMEKLKGELEKLGDLDMAQFGFEELEASLEDVKDDGFDEEGAIGETPYSRSGDVFVLGNHRLMVGDSTLKEDVDKLCDGRQADLVLTDPPYNVDYEGQDGMKVSSNYPMPSLIVF